MATVGRMCARGSPFNVDQSRAPARGDKALRGLRALTLAMAVACAGMLPFAQGLVQPAALPVIGKYFVPVEPTILPVDNYPRTAVVGT